jgi:hypothetical protein
VSDDDESGGSDDIVLPAVTVLQPTGQLPSGYWDEENARLKQFGRSPLLQSAGILSIYMFNNLQRQIQKILEKKGGGGEVTSSNLFNKNRGF